MDQVPYQVRKRITMVSQRAVAGRCWMVKSILVECAASQREGNKPYRCGKKIWARIHMLTHKIQTVKIGFTSNVIGHILLRPFLLYCLGSAGEIAVKCLLAQRDKLKIKHSNASGYFFSAWFGFLKSGKCAMH